MDGWIYSTGSTRGLLDDGAPLVFTRQGRKFAVSTNRWNLIICRYFQRLSMNPLHRTYAFVQGPGLSLLLYVFLRTTLFDRNVGIDMGALHNASTNNIITFVLLEISTRHLVHIPQSARGSRSRYSQQRQNMSTNTPIVQPWGSRPRPPQLPGSTSPGC